MTRKYKTKRKPPKMSKELQEELIRHANRYREPLNIEKDWNVTGFTDEQKKLVMNDFLYLVRAGQKYRSRGPGYSLPGWAPYCGKVGAKCLEEYNALGKKYNWTVTPGNYDYWFKDMRDACGRVEYQATREELGICY